jgi:hypothetical protein
VPRYSYLDYASAGEGAILKATVNELLEVALQALAKVLEHRRPSREYDILEM